MRRDVSVERLQRFEVEDSVLWLLVGAACLLGRGSSVWAELAGQARRLAEACGAVELFDIIAKGQCLTVRSDVEVKR